MCLVIAFVCFGMAYLSYDGSNTTAMWVNIALGIMFVGLMIRNIYKTKQERNNS